jgi:hypothetical protein
MRAYTLLIRVGYHVELQTAAMDYCMANKLKLPKNARSRIFWQSARLKVFLKLLFYVTRADRVVHRLAALC